VKDSQNHLLSSSFLLLIANHCPQPSHWPGFWQLYQFGLLQKIHWDLNAYFVG
jgi:hypothetical protein